MVFKNPKRIRRKCFFLSKDKRNKKKNSLKNDQEIDFTGANKVNVNDRMEEKNGTLSNIQMINIQFL